MLTKYWSLSQQGHLQPHSKSKASQPSTELQNGILPTAPYPTSKFVESILILFSNSKTQPVPFFSYSTGQLEAYSNWTEGDICGLRQKV